MIKKLSWWFEVNIIARYELWRNPKLVPLGRHRDLWKPYDYKRYMEIRKARRCLIGLYWPMTCNINDKTF